MSYKSETERKVILECSKILQFKDFGSYSAETGFTSAEAFNSVTDSTGDDPRPIFCLLSLSGFDPNGIFFPYRKDFLLNDYAHRMRLDDPVKINALKTLVAVLNNMSARARSAKSVDRPGLTAGHARHVLSMIGTEDDYLFNAETIAVEESAEYIVPFEVNSKDFVSPRVTESEIKASLTRIPFSDHCALFDVILASRKVPFRKEATPSVIEYAAGLFEGYLSCSQYSSSAIYKKALIERDFNKICLLAPMAIKNGWISPAQINLRMSTIKNAWLHAKTKFRGRHEVRQALEAMINQEVKKGRKPKSEKGALPSTAKESFHVKLFESEQYGGRWLRVKVTGPFTKDSLTLSAFPVSYGENMIDHVVKFSQIEEVMNDSRVNNRFCKNCGCLEHGYSNLAKRWMPKCDGHEFVEFEND